ncbi:hypothetical protein H671_1g4288 [Cricetulus griseus]|nr:hypothetical protein H671_1g4288 [Cricetulus griseus]
MYLRKEIDPTEVKRRHQNSWNRNMNGCGSAFGVQKLNLVPLQECTCIRSHKHLFIFVTVGSGYAEKTDSRASEKEINDREKCHPYDGPKSYDNPIPHFTTGTDVPSIVFTTFQVKKLKLMKIGELAKVT